MELENYSNKIKYNMLKVVNEIQDYLNGTYKDEHKTLSDFQKYYMSLGLNNEQIVLWFKQNDIIENNPFICYVSDIPPELLKAIVINENVNEELKKLFQNNQDLILQYGIQHKLILYLDYSKEACEEEAKKYQAIKNSTIFLRMMHDVMNVCKTEYYKMISGIENKISISVNGREVTEFNMLPDYYKDPTDKSLFGYI